MTSKLLQAQPKTSAWMGCKPNNLLTLRLHLAFVTGQENRLSEPQFMESTLLGLGPEIVFS